jgi:hypothetical protein
MPGAPPDVFISYAHEDVERAEWAFRVLTARGWSVWFDRDLVGGARWRKLIDEMLDDVGCVVVLWSGASIESDWVMDEAGEGMGRGVLVPVLLDDVEIPIGFRQAQAIDLVAARVPREEDEAALVTAVANVLGRPAVIEAPKPSRLVRRLRREAPLAAAILPLAIALPVLLRPASAGVVDLDVIATEIAFVSTHEQDLLDRMVVPSLDADGLASIHWPRTRSTDERVTSAADGRGLGLRVATDVPSGATGSLTIEGIRLGRGTRVVLAMPDPQSVRISLADTAPAVDLSVDGVLRTTPVSGDPTPTDFGGPKPLLLELDPRGTDLVLRTLDADRQLVSAALQVESLSLTRLDETLETTRTNLAVESTIRSGTIRFDAPDGTERSIGAGERLRFEDPSGEIRELALADGAFRMRFLGRVGNVESCTSDEECESWMPSTLESLVARRLPLVLAIAALYGIVIVMLTGRRLRLSGRALVLAIVFLAGGSTPAGALTSLISQDPAESIKRLVVRVESVVGFGSGIILGTRSDTLFLATANHVVRRGGEVADAVDVRVYWQPDVPIRAVLLPDSDGSLDLALLAVSPLASLPADTASFARMRMRPSAATADPGIRDPTSASDQRFSVGAIPFDRLGDLDILERGDPIWLLGQPNGLPWRINTSPERFIGFRGESLDFESNLLARGHSGGALLNEDYEVIGMLKSDQAPYGEAVALYAIARRLEDWGYPVDLRLRAPQLSAAQGRTCVLTSLGDTRCVGYDDRYEPGPIDFSMRVKQLSIRDDHACGVAAGGRAFCLGNNASGQLGDGTTVSRYDAPTEVTGGLTFESIAAGSGHTCGVVTDGDVYCWGLASAGQLGSSYDEDRSTPTRVPTTERFRTVSAMWQYTCGLTLAGEAWCWGAVAGSAFRRSPPTHHAPELVFTSLAAGWYQVCGITAAGRAYCWGFNDDGQLGTGAPGDGFDQEPRAVSGDHSFTSIRSGVAHTCGVTLQREMWCWGLNNFGQLGNGTTENSAVPVRVSGEHVFDAVSTGDLHTCGLTPTGEVWCWGDNGIVGSHEGGGVQPGGETHYTEPVRTMTLDPEERRPWRRRGSVIGPASVQGPEGGRIRPEDQRPKG